MPAAKAHNRRFRPARPPPRPQPRASPPPRPGPPDPGHQALAAQGTAIRVPTPQGPRLTGVVHHTGLAALREGTPGRRAPLLTGSATGGVDPQRTGGDSTALPSSSASRLRTRTPLLTQPCVRAPHGEHPRGLRMQLCLQSYVLPAS
ncbi:hypothetical protein P7K49_009478 [Saguinus oedipus]|uniref:Uncharacterized protein n=1 Tax=Saguinus oedipus TaxID=9490 RepID=A0ABQ9VN81_SAGOE|nr:hypothetical protein P7K49_009478 [Saguinus oedipus]